MIGKVIHSYKIDDFDLGKLVDIEGSVSTV